MKTLIYLRVGRERCLKDKVGHRPESGMFLLLGKFLNCFTTTSSAKNEKGNNL